MTHANSNSPQRFTQQAGQSLAGQRLDQGLVVSGITESRSQAQQLIKNQLVWVNGKNEKNSYKLQVGDSIQVELPAKVDIDLTPYDFPVDVVYEDEDLIVVNKPAGLVVHPAYGHPNDTLINALIHRRTQLSPGSDPIRPGLVHRIDKGTSGLLVLAKNETTHRSLAKQFLNKTIHRRYWALCFSNKRLSDGTIQSYLTRDPNHRQKYMSLDEEKGKLAITHYKTLCQKQMFQLFELTLETGRTHQIRVHLSSQHNPIVGDDLYNGKNQAKALKNQALKKIILEMDRFALHAKELGFYHPNLKQKLLFNSPIPKDLHPLFDLGGFSEYL
jgi:23S rRNA pseudouridine1911/1915/1917 synthase